MKLSILSITVSTTILISFASAQSTPSAQTTDGAAQLRDRYAQLSQEIYATHLEPGSGKHFYDKSRLAEVRSELRSLIQGRIESVLGGPNPTTDQIAAAIGSLQGQEHALGSAGGDTPWADFFVLGGARQVAVAYNTLEGGDGIPDTHAYLDFYRSVGGGWEVAAHSPTEQDFRGASYDVRQMDSGVPSESWFIAWGTRFGDDAGRLRVRLYGYDGTAVRTIWKRDELIGGSIQVTKSTVTLDYYKAYKSEDPNNHVQQTLRVTPFGLE